MEQWHNENSVAEARGYSMKRKSFTAILASHLHPSRALPLGVIASSIIVMMGCQTQLGTYHHPKANPPELPVRNIPKELVGTWYSKNAIIVEWNARKTTWKLFGDGTYEISGEGTNDTERANWWVEGNTLVRWDTKRKGPFPSTATLGYPYRLSADGRTLTYGGTNETRHMTSPEYVFVRVH